MAKAHKYRAKAVEIDGHKFPSKAEANRYAILRLREKAHEIEDLELQPKFPIVINGFTICNYFADFRYVDRMTGETIVEDTKGYATPIYRLKKKLVRAVHGIDILEVK